MTLKSFKVVILGDTSVGKTCLFESILHHRFSGNESPTIGADFAKKTVLSTQGERFVLELWDTAGCERFNSMTQLFYRGASAAIVCYDITDANSWLRVMFWVSELKKNEEECKIYLCGTKLDLINEGYRERAVEDVELYAAEIQAKSIETSSKTRKNVDKLFQMIVDDSESKPILPGVPVAKDVYHSEDKMNMKCC